MTAITTKTTAGTRRTRINPFTWLVRLEAAYRQHRALRQATPEQLDDMGISRQDADIAFYRQFAARKYT